MSLNTAMKQIVDRAGSQFDDIARLHFPDGRWGVYRAYECDPPVPKDAERAMDDYHKATQRYYLIRDGHGGTLGGTRQPVTVFSPLGGLVTC